MELVELNPSLQPGLDPKQTLDLGLSLIGSAMGQAIL